MVEQLTDVELAMLAIERRTWLRAGSKEQHVRDVLDMSATRYYQVLNVLLDDERALATDPVTVYRLRRLRASRMRKAARPGE